MILFASMSQAQDVSWGNELSPVAQKVASLGRQTKSAAFRLFQPSTEKSLEKKSNYHRFEIWSVSAEGKKRLLKSSDKLLKIDMLYPGFSILVYPVQLWKNIEMSQTKHFRGIVDGKPNSLVTLNVSEDAVSGIISTSQGNWVIQPTKGGQESIVLFREQDVKTNPSFTCQNEYDPSDYNQVVADQTHLKSNEPLAPVSIYFHCDYAMFAANGFSRDKTITYMEGIFSQVAALYENESITLLIEDIFIWEETDPFNSASAAKALGSFYSHLNGQFPGDLAHLVSGVDSDNGGVAMVNGVCDRSRAYGYSNVDGSYENAPSYSWDVHVIAHEIGHNLGSPHTHDCAWGPNQDQALDNCYSNQNACGEGPAPVSGGTIMSYCHLSPYGVNFSLGLGAEPGDLIRNTIRQCQPERGFTCEEALVIRESGIYQAAGPSQGNGAKHAPATHANWYVFSPATDGRISIGSCGQGEDTRMFVYDGECSGLRSIAVSDDDCTSGSGYNYASMLDGFKVIAGTTYFFEWDNRWSSNSFQFEFTFEPLQSACENAGSIDDIITTSTDYYSSSAVEYNGRITENGSLHLGSGAEIVFENGFEISAGGQIEVSVEDCETFYRRLQSRK
jgi:hypothetical protein